MFSLVYVTAVNPNMMVSFFEMPDQPSEIGTIETVVETPETSNNPTYLDHIEKGITLFDNHFYPLAITEFEMAVTLEPSLSEPFYRLGSAYFYNKEYENAQTAFKTALENNSSNIEASVMLGKTYLAQEAFETAKTHFDTAPPESTEVLYYRALLNAFFGDYENAKIDLNKVIAAGDSPDLAKNSQNFLSAIEEAGLAQDGNLNYVKTLIARSYSESNESNLAINLLYEVLSQEPTYRDAWIILGYTYLSLNQYKDSIDALLKALELDPTKAETRYFLGLSYFGEDEYTSAVTQIELAIESGYEPRVQAYQKLADIAVLDAEFKKAADAYEKVLVINSSDVNLYIRPIWLYIDKLNNLPRAIELGELAVSEHPNEAMSYNLLGWAQTANNDFTNAEHNLNYSLILDANLAASNLNLGWLSQKQGNLDAAKKYYKQCYTIEPDTSIGNLAANRYNEILTQEEAPSNPPS